MPCGTSLIKSMIDHVVYLVNARTAGSQGWFKVAKKLMGGESELLKKASYPETAIDYHQNKANTPSFRRGLPLRKLKS